MPDDIQQPQLPAESGAPTAAPTQQQAAPQQSPQPEPSSDVTVLSPDGQLGTVPADQLQDAINQGYRHATPEMVHKHTMEQKYGGAGQQALTALEGAGVGASFGLSTGAETNLFGVNPEDIRGRAETNPTTHAVGEVGGLAGSLLIPVAGEANILRGAGEAAVAATGLAGKAGFLNQVGAHAVQGAFEMGLFQGGEEVSKTFAQDPDQSAENAVAHMGLAAVMGGVFGGALGAASQGLKKLTPSFVSEIDRAAVESGDLKASIEHSNLLKPGEKTSILDGLSEEKPDAAKIRAAAQELGAPVMEGMTSNSRWVQKAEDALINGAPTYSGLRRQGLYTEGFNKASSAVTEAIGEGSELSKAELGNSIKKSLTSALEEENAPIAQMYERLKAVQDVIPLEKEATTELKSALAELKELRLAPSSTEGRMVKRVIDEIGNAKTVDDLKVYKSTLSVSPTASSGEKRIAGILRDQINKLEEDNIERSFSKMQGIEGDAASLKASRKDAAKQYRDFIGKVQTLSEQLGKGRVYGVQDAIHFIQDRLTPEEVTQRLFSKNNSEFLKFFEKEFPDQMELLRQYQKSGMKEAASRTGEFSPKLFFNNLNKLEPEVQKSIFKPEELKRIQAAETYIRAMPKNFNPSGTSHLQAFRNAFEHPVGTVTANARDFAIEKFIKAVSASPEVNQAGQLAKSTVNGFKSMINAVKNVFKNDSGALVIALPSASKRAALSKLVDELTKNPDKLLSINANNPIPQYSTSFAQTTARAMNYLNEAKPKEDKQSPLDTPTKPTPAQKQAYDRALDLAQQPLMILDKVKNGSILPQDIKAIQTIYPKLYNQLAERLMTQMADTVNKGGIIPYKTRLGLSMFLAQPMDSTMAPNSIRAAQPMPKQQPQQQGGGSPKKSTSSLNKLPGSYQTSLQSAEQNKNKH